MFQPVGIAALPESNALYFLVVVAVIAAVSEKFRAMPFLVLVLATGLYGVMQGEALPWTAGEFNLGFGQTIAASGLAIIAGAMVARLAESSAAAVWWRRRLSGKAGPAVMAVIATVAGLGGSPIAALAVLTPMIRAAGAARERIALAASFCVNASHGCLVPAPVPIAALAILGGDWLAGLVFGIPVAAAQIALGWALARRHPAGSPAMAETSPPVLPLAPRRAVLGVVLALLVMIGLIIAQSLGQIPSEPLGGGPIRENLLGLGRPLILLLAGVGAALLAFAGFSRQGLGDEGWVAQGARSASGVLLAVGAAGGFQMVLHNNGMADALSERVLGLSPLFGIAVPFLVALVNRALQGSPLTAAITAAGMIQPLLLPLGLQSGSGRALAALAVGAGVMAIPHVNDGYFWLAGDLAGLRPLQALRRISGGALAQGAVALAVLCLLALTVR